MASLGWAEARPKGDTRSRASLVAAWHFQEGRAFQPRCGLRPRPTQGDHDVRFYDRPHRFYAGIALHARTLSLCVLDRDGRTAFHQSIAASPDAFLGAVAPFRDGLVVACECMFAWYWLADCCHEQGIPFVLGHAL